MAGITNRFIDSFLVPIANTFYGTFSADNINQQLLHKERFSIICNLSNAHEAGSHFVAIIVMPTYIFYIDSFGLVCFTQPIIDFMNKLSRPVFCNVKVLQDPNSSHCGFFSMLFVLFFDMNKPFQLKFVTQLTDNDSRCTEYIKRMIRLI